MTWVGDQDLKSRLLACCCPGIASSSYVIHGGTPRVSTGMLVSNLRTKNAGGRFLFFSGRRVESRSQFRLAADLVEVVGW